MNHCHRRKHDNGNNETSLPSSTSRRERRIRFNLPFRGAEEQPTHANSRLFTFSVSLNDSLRWSGRFKRLTVIDEETLLIVTIGEGW